MTGLLTGEGVGWVLLSLISAVFAGAFYLVNQYFKQPGHYVVIFSRVIAVVVLTPLMAVITWPTDPVFYGAVFLSALLGAFSDIRIFNVAGLYGGGVVSRLQPFSVFISFLLWPIYDPGIITRYLAHPLASLGIFLSIIGCVFFATRLKNCEINKQAMAAVLPTVFAYAVTVILNKVSMDHAPLQSGVYGYIYFQCIFAVMLVGASTLYLARKGKVQKFSEALRSKIIWQASGALFAMWLLTMIPKMYAVAFASNPSYVAALSLTAPFWIALFYFCVKHTEKAEVKNGMGIVVCAIILAALTMN